MRSRVRVIGLLIVSVGVLHAANIDKPLAETEGRRRAAETGVRQIKAKSVQDAEQVRALYTGAASRQNAWLDLACQGIEQSAPAAPDVAAAAQTAASTLLEWVVGRNRALGQPIMADKVAESVKASIVRDLTDIADEVWRSHRGANSEKRTKSIADLRSRLLWKPWDEVR